MMRNKYIYLLISSLLLISCTSLSTIYVNKHTGHTMEKLNVKNAQKIVHKIRKDKSSFFSPTDFFKKIKKKNYTLIIYGSIGGGGLYIANSTIYVRIDYNSGKIDTYYLNNNNQKFRKEEKSLNNPYTIIKAFTSNGIQISIDKEYYCGSNPTLDSLGSYKYATGPRVFVGYNYTYDLKGNIVNIINHDLGYPITPLKIKKIIKEKFNISNKKIKNLSKIPYITAKHHFLDYFKDSTNINHNIWAVMIERPLQYNQIIIIDAQNGNIISKKNAPIPVEGPHDYKMKLFVSITSIISLFQQSYAQSDSTKVKIENKKDLIDKIVTSKEEIEIDSIIVKGIIKEEEDGPLPGANILQKGTTTRTKTDFDGKFEIILTKKNKNEKIILQISYLGFETKEIEIDAQNGNIISKFYVIDKQ